MAFRTIEIVFGKRLLAADTFHLGCARARRIGSGGRHGKLILVVETNREFDISVKRIGRWRFAKLIGRQTTAKAQIVRPVQERLSRAELTGCLCLEVRVERPATNLGKRLFKVQIICVHKLL